MPGGRGVRSLSQVRRLRLQLRLNGWQMTLLSFQLTELSVDLLSLEMLRLPGLQLLELVELTTW